MTSEKASIQKIGSVQFDFLKGSTAERFFKRSVPVLWTLAVSRRSLIRNHELQKDEYFTQASPFDLETITQERTGHLQIKDHGSPDEPSQNVIEVTTSVYDPQRRSTRRNPKFHSRRLNKELHSCLILGQSVILHSSLIRKCLQSIMEYYPAHPPSRFDDVVTIDEPFAVLMHHFPKIEEYVESDHSDEAAHNLACSHLMILRNFLKPRYEDIQTSIRPAIQANAIEFDSLWYTLRPGIDVYIVTNGNPHVCVIESVAGERGSPTKPSIGVKQWSIRMWCLDTADGLTMSRKCEQSHIKRFNGMRDMISLPVCPVSVWDALDAGARRAQVMRRNSMYLEGLQRNQSGHMHCYYDGPDIENGGRVSRLSQASFYAISYRPQYRGKVVIDHQNSDILAAPEFLSPDQYTEFAEYDDIYLRDQPPIIPKTGRNN